MVRSGVQQVGTAGKIAGWRWVEREEKGMEREKRVRHHVAVAPPSRLCATTSDAQSPALPPHTKCRASARQHCPRPHTIALRGDDTPPPQTPDGLSTPSGGTARRRKERGGGGRRWLGFLPVARGRGRRGFSCQLSCHPAAASTWECQHGAQPIRTSLAKTHA